MDLREDITIGKLLRETAAAYPERPALKSREAELSYRQLDEAVDIAARRLISCGIKRGDHVGTLCETQVAEVVIYYALARIGAVNVMFNTSLKAAELRELLINSDVSVLLVGSGYRGVSFPSLVQNIRSGCPLLKEVLLIGDGRSEQFRRLSSIEPCPEEMLRSAEAAVLPSDTAQILFTSGTTSSPKMVMGSHYSRANSGRFQAKDLGATREDIFLGALPLFHCFSISVNIMAACSVGACLVLPASRRTSVLLSDIRDYKCTIFSSVPTLFFAIIRRPDFASWDVSSVRTGFIGGSSYSAAQFAEIEKSFGMTLLSSLGQTESTAGTTTSDLTDSLEIRATTLGHMMDFVEGRIADPDTNETLPAGQQGEICVRGYVVMQGYYNNPEATARAIDKDGWLHTGDWGWFGEDGYLRLSGRLKELIIRGGENISPVEIQSAVWEIPGVQDCRAIGVPDPHYGEVVCLCVAGKRGSELSEDAIRAHLSERLAEYKQPRYILFFRDLPLKNTGKVDAVRLRNDACERLGIELPEAQA
ncbi:MAG: AMP-binding protein [Firmicutes bacterium]|nr:AMP-binding protein [Bacillota bacterium]